MQPSTFGNKMKIWRQTSQACIAIVEPNLWSINVNRAGISAWLSLDRCNYCHLSECILLATWVCKERINKFANPIFLLFLSFSGDTKFDLDGWNSHQLSGTIENSYLIWEIISMKNMLSFLTNQFTLFQKFN